MFAGTLSISEGSTVAFESTLFSNNTGVSGATVQVGGGICTVLQYLGFARPNTPVFRKLGNASIA